MIYDTVPFIDSATAVDSRIYSLFIVGTADPQFTISCTGELKVHTTHDGLPQVETYNDLSMQTVDFGADANTEIYLVGDITYIDTMGADVIATDLRYSRKLVELHVSGANNLLALNLASCKQLTTLYVTDCSALTRLPLYTNIALEKLILDGCTALQNLDLLCNKMLEVVSLANCSTLSYLDLTMLYNLRELNVTGTQLRSPENNLLINTALHRASCPKVSVSETTASIEPGKLYEFVGTPAALDITMTPGDIASAVSEFWFTFVAGENFELTLTPEVTWQSDPTFTAGKTYEINVVNNLALCAEYGE